MARVLTEAQKQRARDAAKRWRENNIERARASNREWYKKNTARAAAKERARRAKYPERISHQLRARKYVGYSKEWFDGQLRSHGGCAICGTTLPGKRGWQVDHDHVTGKVRGVLCVRCNVSIGQAGDDPMRLRQAADYLEKAK